MPCGTRRRDESGAFPGAPSSPPHLRRLGALAPIASVIVITREHHLATRPRPRQVRDALGQVRTRALMTSGSGDEPLRRPAAARLLFRWLASASRGTNVRAEHLPVAPADHRYGDTDGQRASVSLGPKGLAVPPRPAKGRAGVQSPRCRLAFLPSGEGTLPVASLSRARRGNQRAFVTPPWLAPTTRVAQRGEGSARPCFRRGRGRSARNGRTCTKGRAARCAANNRGPIWTPPPDFARPKCTKSRDFYPQHCPQKKQQLLHRRAFLKIAECVAKWRWRGKKRIGVHRPIHREVGRTEGRFLAAPPMLCAPGSVAHRSRCSSFTKRALKSSASGKRADTASGGKTTSFDVRPRRRSGQCPMISWTSSDQRGTAR